jgi:hypothetical protein
MKNGDMIKRHPGESLVKAAERIAGINTPHVMLGLLDLETARDRQESVQSFYQAEQRRARIVEVSSDEVSEEAESEDLESEEGGVYLTHPYLVNKGPASVQAAERAETGIRKARKMVFDGVYPPKRGKVQPGEVRDLTEQSGTAKEAPALLNHPVTGPSGSGAVADRIPVRAVTPKPADLPPDIRPIEAR